MARNVIAGLDVGTSAVRLCVCNFEKNEKTPRIIATIQGEAQGLRHGYIVNPEEASTSIRKVVREAEKVCGFKLRRTMLGIGGITLGSSISDGSAATAKADLEVTALDTKRALAAAEENIKDPANKQIIHSIPISFKLDGKKVLGRPEGLKGSNLEARALVVTALEQHINDMIEATEDAGISVENIVASPIAASFAALSKIQKIAGSILVNIGAETVSVVIFEENIPVSLQVFPLGSHDITKDIALGLRVSLEEAEDLKIGKNETTSKKKLDEIIEARLADIFELIESHLKRNCRAGLLPAGAIITGGGAALAMMETLAKSELTLPVKIMRDINAIFIGKNESERGKRSLNSKWAVAYGLTFLGYDSEVEESIGLRLARETQKNIFSWLKEFMP